MTSLNRHNISDHEISSRKHSTTPDHSRWWHNGNINQSPLSYAPLHEQ